MDDPLNLSMFRAYDIRTPAARLTAPLAERLASAEALYFQEVLGADGVVVAHDARSAGPRYLDLAASVFLRAGLEVLVLPGPCSTSMLYFAAMRHPGHAAVMFGASHNPADDTGQKLVAPGMRPIAEGIGPEGGLSRIKRDYQADARARDRAGGKIRAINLLDQYIEFSMEQAGVAPGDLRGITLLQDYLFGAAGPEMMLAFERAGATLTPLHFAADGAFPLGDPNPVNPDVIRPGLDALKSGEFHLGMFFDGDGDRIDLYRGDGTYLAPSFAYAAILPRIRNRAQGKNLGVFADLKANPLAVMEMAKSGLIVDVVRNGHSQIKQALHDDPKRIGAVEESAHFYQAFSTGPSGSRFCTENTLYFALLIARVWKEDPDWVDHMFALQRETAREREWGYKFPTIQARHEALQAVRSHFEGTGAQAMERMKNGMDLEATLLRRGLPFEIDATTRLTPDWLQVCQRVSQSEDALARWDAVGANAELVSEAKRAIAAITQRFGAGEEYRG